MLKGKHTTKSYSTGALVMLSCMVYFVSYLARKNYGVSLAVIIEETGFSAASMGIVESALLLFYGIGQIVSGFLGDKFKPQNVILSGLIVTGICNIIFPFFHSIAAFTVIWGINGMAQAMFWPPLVKIMAEYLSSHKYKLACSHISAASQIATIFLYLFIPLILTMLNWHWVFYISSITAVAMAVIWIICYKKITKKMEKVQKTELQEKPEEITSGQKIKLAPVMLSCGMITILLSIAFQGFLRDGVTTWMPKYTASHGVSTENAILMNVLMPIFSIGVTYLITFIYSKFFKNELTAATVFFVIASFVIGLIFLLNQYFPGVSPIISVVLAGISVGLMHGINIMLISYVPERFASMNAVSTLSGITNAFTYAGSAISTYLIPLFAESFGWNYTILLWFGVAFMGLISCLVTIRRWRRFINATK